MQPGPIWPLFIVKIVTVNGATKSLVTIRARDQPVPNIKQTLSALDTRQACDFSRGTYVLIDEHGKIRESWGKRAKKMIVDAPWRTSTITGCGVSRVFCCLEGVFSLF